MPIRSPKGRGAAYRALWQWPLRSPARLVGCLIVLLIVGVGLNAATGLLRTKHSGGLFGSVGSSTGSGVTPKPDSAGAPGPLVPTRLPPVAELTPAALPLALVQEIEAAALNLYTTLGCRDVARLDFRIRDGVPYFLEINPLPGLNPESSDLVIMARLLGVTHAELVERILVAALTRLGLA